MMKNDPPRQAVAAAAQAALPRRRIVRAKRPRLFEEPPPAPATPVPALMPRRRDRVDEDEEVEDVVYESDSSYEESDENEDDYYSDDEDDDSDDDYSVEEDDSEEEDDDSEFDEDDFLPDAMVQFMRAAIIHANDSDEQEECNCPACRRLRDNNNATAGNDDDDDDDDDDSSACNCPDCQMERYWCRACGNNNNLDDDSSSTEEVDENAPCCAICLQPEGRRRTLLVLPCCGQAAESTSTMRFCQLCLVTCLLKTHGTGPCPRCHALITLSNNNNSNNNSSSKNNRSSKTIQPASTADILQHIARQPNGGAVLVAAAWGLGKQVPAECFSNYQHDALNEATWVRRLVTWKFLTISKKRPGRYNLALPQRPVREWVSRHLRPDDDEDCFALVRHNLEITKAISKQCLFSCLAQFAAAWTLLKKAPCKNLGIAARLANRALTLFLVGLVDTRLLPSPLDWNAAAPYFATALNFVVLFLVMKITYRLLFVAFYVGGFVALAKLAGFFMLGNPWQQLKHTSQQGMDYLRPYLTREMGRRILGLAAGRNGRVAILAVAVACKIIFWRA